MKKTFHTLAIAFALFACNNKKAENPPLAPTELAKDAVMPPQPQTAKNSLSYLGLYKGTLPCADCEGIETSLQLAEDFSYVLTMKYLGKSDKIFESKGSYAWNKAGNAIIINNKDGATSQYLVGEKSLTQLDGDGQKITGNLASHFILKKISEAEAEKEKALSPRELKYDIGQTRWKLTELNGRSITNKTEKVFFVAFKPTGDFSAFAGCNNMRGHYELGKDSGIKFLRVMSTMMACPDMKPENRLKIALETADNFVANEKVLQLRNGGNALAKFEAEPKSK